jgi:hypothetical protein
MVAELSQNDFNLKSRAESVWFCSTLFIKKDTGLIVKQIITNSYTVIKDCFFL